MLKEVVPAAHEELETALPLIEAAYRDMADVEFTVESGRLWILQARSGQRSGQAAVRIAVDIVDEGLIEVDEALDRIPVSALEQTAGAGVRRSREAGRDRPRERRPRPGPAWVPPCLTPNALRSSRPTARR